MFHSIVLSVDVYEIPGHIEPIIYIYDPPSNIFFTYGLFHEW